jgi:ribonuclease HII
LIIPGWTLEQSLREQGYALIAGVDEAGRGAWAGPLSVGVVILPITERDYPFRDSKTLSSSKRAEYAARVREHALAWAVEFSSSAEIDRLGVLNATHAAALRAMGRLEPSPEALITDYLKLKTPLPYLAPPRADADSFSVAAASLLAKVARDQHLLELDLEFPDYGFAAHKGYGTPIHTAALEKYGPCVEHRRSFAPVSRALERRLLE